MVPTKKEELRNLVTQTTLETYEELTPHLVQLMGMAAANLPGLELTFDGVVLPVVLVWYIFTELGSIAENAAAMGAPVPGCLVKILAEGKGKVEK